MDVERVVMVQFAESNPWVVVLGGLLVFFLSDMTWHVSVVGVVHLLSGSEHGWDVKSIELISGLLDVVLNAITILIVNFSWLVLGHAEHFEFLTNGNKGSLGKNLVIISTIVVSGVVWPFVNVVVLLEVGRSIASSELFTRVSLEMLSLGGSQQGGDCKLHIIII